MSIDLSIITTNYNYTEKLDSLIDNIVAQNLASYEIIVVDDCSDIPCDAIINKRAESGIPVKLVKNQTRQYTKNSRLNGIDAANGKLITFIDADDLFYGTKALQYHVDLQKAKDVDILHFSTYHTENGKARKVPSPWESILAESLNNEEIFQAFVASKMRHAVTIWGKIIKRELWEQCLPAARASRVRRYSEDVSLISLLYFHAKSYLGSTRLGYQREFVDKNFPKGFGRSVSAYCMLTELVPYYKAHGASDALCLKVKAALLARIKENMLNSVAYHRSMGIAEITDDIFAEMSTHGTKDDIIKAMFTGLM